MTPTMRAAIMEAYTIAEPHLMDELRDDMHVVLLVRFRLGDLRDLARERPAAAGGETTIISGG